MAVELVLWEVGGAGMRECWCCRHQDDGEGDSEDATVAADELDSKQRIKWMMVMSQL